MVPLPLSLVLFSSLFFAASHAQQCSGLGDGPVIGPSCANPVDIVATAPDGTSVCCPPDQLVTVATTPFQTTPSMTTTFPLSFTTSGLFTSSITTSRIPNVVTTRSIFGGQCRDLLNPRTGSSDCPSRRGLCTDPNYIQLMTVQCPLTCGLCTGRGVGGSTTRSLGGSTTRFGQGGIGGNCVDLTNPQTGVSDCPRLRSRCTDPVYQPLMAQQCAATCGLCNGAGGLTTRGFGATTTRFGQGGIGGACVDLINPRTGTSDCPQLRSRCTDPIYQTLMRQQCAATCGFCNGGGVGLFSTTRRVTAPLLPTSAIFGGSTTTIFGQTTTFNPFGSSTTGFGVGGCQDTIDRRTGISDCPSKAYLCNANGYQAFMRTICPLTCGVCGGGLSVSSTTPFFGK